jgi:hypothetical protein
VFIAWQVVGGMTWAIMACNEDVDVDLLFQENSTIGQKMCVCACVGICAPPCVLTGVAVR